MKPLFALIAFAFYFFSANAQSKLQPGFDPKEYAELLSLTYFASSIPDSVERKKTTDPYKLLYRSPETGFSNQWRLYLRDDNVAVIDTRGTVGKTASWLANFYAAMIPATGSLQLNDSTSFSYQLAKDSQAMVHTGWTVSLGHLAPDIVNHIKTLYQEKNVREFLLFGHSQGAAITFLLRSYLHYEQQKGNIPLDILFKTYCSAAPKPGNMQYVYDFDFMTRGGWANTVVNGADWVPETPFSIQQLSDFNPTNPFVNVKENLKKQKLLIRLAGNHIYNRMNGTTYRAEKKMRKYLGGMVYKRAVSKTLPQLKEPEYSAGNNYMRAGVPVILMPDEEYKTKFPESKENVFVHHSFKAYYFLLKKWYLQ